MPSVFVALIIGLSAYRLTRLAGWDDFPLALKIRDWIIGTRWIAKGHVYRLPNGGELTTVHELDAGAVADLDAEVISDRNAEVELPGKQPPSEVEGVRPAYDRPTLAHLVHCPYCVGFWISLAHVAAWYAWHPTIYVMFPFAVSGFVGLVAKNLDA
jgi:hypothetical protein